MIAGLTPTLVAACAATSLAAGLSIRSVFRPPARLRDRVGPYLSPGVVSPRHRGPVNAVFGPMVEDIGSRLSRLLDSVGQEVTLVRLRQAGWFRGAPESEMLSRFSHLQLRTAAISVGGAFVVGQVLGASVLVRLLLAASGLVVGATHTRGRLEKAIDERRELLRIEIYTVNQLLAMRVRAGGGVVQAARAIVDRGRGEVVGEMSEALRLHRSGWAAGDAFRRIAEITPEPFCARTYRLLGAAEERGADLGSALLALSEDVRETRREAIRRAATKRRAAMLVPTIAVLAPILILFVAAPLPYLITSWR